MRKVDVNDLVKEVLSHINVAESVEVVSQLAEALPPILADPNQLSLVFKNIILSWIQAITSSSSVETPEGGQLVVKTSASIRCERSDFGEPATSSVEALMVLKLEARFS